MQLSFSPASASVFVFSLKPSSALFIYLLFFSLIAVVVAGKGANDSIATCEFSTWLIRGLHANINAKIMR